MSKRQGKAQMEKYAAASMEHQHQGATVVTAPPSLAPKRVWLCLIRPERHEKDFIVCLQRKLLSSFKAQRRVTFKR